jgi:diguanylate cyclase (GGDEF)-like protein
MTGTPEPGDEAPPHRVGDNPIRVVEGRLEEIVNTIQEFAALRFDARAPIGPDGDIVDAVGAGVNFLGEELEASFRDMERRVGDRTAELTLATQELARRALSDELTGLPNRTLFWEHLSHRLALAGRRQPGFAVLFLDIDDFKTLNDTLGHAAGDRLLVDVASRLRTALREGDTAARVGGDEFVVLLDEVRTQEGARVVAERLLEVLRAPYEIGADRWIATVSIGVAIGPASFRTADEVVGAADTAMYKAKQRGGGRYVLYSEDLHGRRGGRPIGPRLDGPTPGHAQVTKGASHVSSHS